MCFAASRMCSTTSRCTGVFGRWRWPVLYLGTSAIMGWSLNGNWVGWALAIGSINDTLHPIIQRGLGGGSNLVCIYVSLADLYGLNGVTFTCIYGRDLNRLCTFDAEPPILIYWGYDVAIVIEAFPMPFRDPPLQLVICLHLPGDALHIKVICSIERANKDGVQHLGPPVGHILVGLYFLSKGI